MILEGLTSVNMYAMSLKNSRLFGKIINSSKKGYPIVKSLAFSQKTKFLYGIRHIHIYNRYFLHLYTLYS